jgi:hypothetical protein
MIDDYEDGWIPGDEWDIYELPEEILEAINKSIKGALWQCSSCGKVFALPVESVETAIPDRAKNGCIYCSGGDSAKPVIYLLSFLTEEELNEMQSIHTGVALGITKFISWEED